MTPFTPENTIVIRNPVSGRFFSRRRAAKLEAILEERGYTVVHTQQPRHATEIAQRFVDNQQGAVVLIGGDGTVMEAVQKLPHQTPIAVFPTGTVNLLARALAIPRNIDDWLQLFESGRLRPAYGATCNGKAFLSVASTGLTARAVEHVNPRWKKFLQEFAYGIAAFVQFFKYKNPAWKISLDGEAEDMAVQGVVMGLGPHYGGPKLIFPDADPHEAKLEVCLLAGTHKWILWKYVWGMLTGKLPWMQGPVYRKVSSLRVEAEPPMSVELDGDFFGTTPIDIRVDAEPRRYLAP